MPKISSVGLGKYIRNPRKRKEVMRVEIDEGNGFRCYPIKAVNSTRVELDYERYLIIPKDDAVEEVTI